MAIIDPALQMAQYSAQQGEAAASMGSGLSTLIGDGQMWEALPMLELLGSGESRR